jgi:hypothetical protein
VNRGKRGPTALAVMTHDGEITRHKITEIAHTVTRAAVVVNFLQSDDSIFWISSKNRLASLPRVEKAAKNNHLAEMICVMVGNEQGFAENRLSCPVRNSRK